VFPIFFKSEAFREAVLQLQADKKGGRIRGQDVLNLMREKLGIIMLIFRELFKSYVLEIGLI
jgi:hypothetical protein